MSHDIYNYQKRLEYVLRKIKEDNKINKRNKKLLTRFHETCIAEGLSIGRIVRSLYGMRTFAEWMKKDFEKCKKDDIVKLVAKLEKSKYAYASKQEMKVTPRKFFKWMRGTEEYPEEVRWFKCRKKLTSNKLPEDLLSVEDVKLLINSATKARDRALIATLYESGCRIGELLSLKFKHVQFDRFGGILLVTGKTGARRVRVISCVHYLKEWFDKHPKKDDPEFPIWILERKLKPLGHNDVQRILRRIKKLSGIRKKTNAHNFRHSRATHLAGHLSDALLKEMFGWVQSSRMASVYIHLSGKTVDNALLELYGIKKDKDKKEDIDFKIRKCIRCKKENSPTDKFCKQCGMVLDEKLIIDITKRDMERRKADDILDQLIKDPQFKDLFLNKIREVV